MVESIEFFFFQNNVFRVFILTPWPRSRVLVLIGRYRAKIDEPLGASVSGISTHNLTVKQITLGIIAIEP